MSTITFDTLELVEKLTAEAQASLVTRDDLDQRLDKALAPIYTDLAVLKWMLGVLLAGVISLVLKTFF